MRQIERDMLNTIRENRDHWQKDNTRVERLDDWPNTHRIYLHNNHIADAWADCTGNIYATPNMDTLREWPTMTTMSRLWALGIKVYRSNNVIYHGNDVVCEAWR